MTETKTFHWLDYLIFSLMLAISAAIGLFYAWKDKRNQSTDEFLLGGRRMSVLPVTLSLMANFLSAVLVLGVPTEIYYNGTMYWLTSFSNFITFPIAVHVFLPLFHNLQLTSVNKYLQLRFNGILRILGSIIFQVQMFLYMAVMLYAPALALNQVMGFSMMVSILVIGLVCTLYTAIGGLKAVLWTDAFQIVIVFSGLLALVIKATTELGGFEYVWNTAKNAGKLQINNFDPDPFVRNTFWTLVIGGFMTSLTIYGGNQAVIQRYLSMETVRSAQTALYINLPASIVFTSLLVYAGLVLFAKYGEADPVGCAIDRRDQMIPWLVMDILGDYHGFPGLMVACIFSASLSTVSSGVNALALVFTSDIIEPLYLTVTKEHIPNKHATICSKMLAFLFGFLTIGLAFTADKMGNLILQISFSIFGMIGGPLLGLFIMAMFFPCINSWGAGLGTMSGLTFAFWLGVGSIIKTGSPPIPTCKIIDMNLSHPDNVTFSPEYINSLSPIDITTVLGYSSLTTVHGLSTTGNTMELGSTESGLDKFYRLSYMWYSASSIIVGIFVALIVSCATGGTRKKPVEEKLLAPLYLYLKSFAKTKYSYEKERKGRQNETRKRMTSSGVTLYVQSQSPHQELQPTNDHRDIVTHL